MVVFHENNLGVLPTYHNMHAHQLKSPYISTIKLGMPTKNIKLFVNLGCRKMRL
jgi:hypothetical protein